MFIGWPRCIVCIDMNAFFASIEQLLQPKLRKKPIAITNGSHGSCVITASYPARAYGVKTGMRFSFARILCPAIIQVASRSAIYEAFSKKLMQILHDQFSPDIEVFSVDEAFLDMTNVYHGFTSPRALAKAIRDCVMKELSLPCSIGVSGDKTTAKYAAKLHKPRGISIIEPAISRQILAPVPVEALCGIGPGTKKYLSRFGATTCGSVGHIPVSVLSKKFGIKGQRLWLMCAGKDPDMVRSIIKPAQTMGHSKILPPGVTTSGLLLGYLDTMAFKLTYRMLLQHYHSDRFICKIVSVKRAFYYELALDQPICDYELLAQWLHQIGKRMVFNGAIKRVQITALDLTQCIQQDLFNTILPARSRPIETVVASINQRFGQSAILPARLGSLFKKVQSSNVISPSWKGAVPVKQKNSIWD